MATVKPVIKKNLSNKEGLALVYIQYVHHSQACLISTGIHVPYKNWDFKKRSVAASPETNAAIKDFGDQVLAKAKLLLSQGVDPAVKAVKSEFSQEHLSLQSLNGLLKFHTQKAEEIRILIKKYKTRERFRNGYGEIVKNSDSYAKRSLEKSLKTKLPNTPATKNLIQAQKERLQIVRVLNKLNNKLKS